MAAKKSNKEYWFCVVGPVDGRTLTNGADLPMRLGIHSAIDHLEKEGVKFGKDCQISSGWGIDQATKDAMDEARYV